MAGLVYVAAVIFGPTRVPVALFIFNKVLCHLLVDTQHRLE